MTEIIKLVILFSCLVVYSDSNLPLLEEQAFLFSSELYNHLNLPETEISHIIEKTQKFIFDHYNPVLLKELQERLCLKSNQDRQELKDTFEEFKNPFYRVNTTTKRMALFKGLGLYVEPEPNILEEIEKSTVHLSEVKIVKGTINSYHIPLAHSMKQLFSIKGLLEATLDYMKFVESQTNVYLNYIQGTLWKRKSALFDKKDGIVLPMHIFFDDVEMGNALGSHAGKNEVGAVYVSIPCLPPSFSSKLDSIIVSDVFYSKDRKKYGNKKVFRKLVDDLALLRDFGVTMKIEGKIQKIYFIPSLILGDNLGLNSILGFVESFTQTHFCRICYVSAEEAKELTFEKKELLRDSKSYEIDCEKKELSKTGIKDTCIFNELKDFNPIENSAVDVMHDVLEGVANYDMAKILLNLTMDKVFKIEYLNLLIKTMDIGFEKGNQPMDISLDYVQNNERLKMSASETLFFARYFGLIIGHVVPETNPVWKFYQKLRDIISILTCPDLNEHDLNMLEILISDHHRMYIRHFGDLKPKYHMLLHYARLVRQSGPVSGMSAMRYESKHVKIKQIVLSTKARRNILPNIAKRTELSMMHFKYDTYNDFYRILGSKDEKDHSIYTLFSDAKNKITLNNVEINSFTYKIETIIITKVQGGIIHFGEITNIYLVDDEVFFAYISLKVMEFNKHYFAYSVIRDYDTKIIKYKNLPYMAPCLNEIKKGVEYVATRFRLH